MKAETKTRSLVLCIKQLSYVIASLINSNVGLPLHSEVGGSQKSQVRFEIQPPRYSTTYLFLP